MPHYNKQKIVFKNPEEFSEHIRRNMEDSIKVTISETPILTTLHEIDAFIKRILYMNKIKIHPMSRIEHILESMNTLKYNNATIVQFFKDCIEAGYVYYSTLFSLSPLFDQMLVIKIASKCFSQIQN